MGEDACIVLGKAFFECVDGFVTEEGDRFVLPDNSAAYVQKLRSLVLEEDSVQAKRMEHFLSTKFSMCDAGALFPSSWTSKLQMGGVTAVELHAKPEYLAEKSEV